MTESTRKKMVYSISAVAVLWAIASMGTSKKEATTLEAPAQAPSVEKMLPTADKLIINIEEKSKQRWGADPFREGQRRRTKILDVARGPVWTLTGIVYNERSPVAYINKKAVRVGGTIDNAKVLNIDRSSVTLLYRGNRFAIEVKRG